MGPVEVVVRYVVDHEPLELALVPDPRPPKAPSGREVRWRGPGRTALNLGMCELCYSEDDGIVSV